MTMAELQEYRHLQRELKEAGESLAKLIENKEKYILHDSVIKSSNLTLQKVVIPIIGRSPEYAVTYRQRKARLTDHVKSLSLKLRAIDEFIQSVDISEIRQIIERRIIEGQSWRKTSLLVYGYPSEDQARTNLNRYLQRTGTPQDTPDPPEHTRR